MIQRFNYLWRRYLYYRRGLEGSGASVCIYDELLRRQVVRKVSIRGIELHVRTYTPDLDVALGAFFSGEYDGLRLTNPRTIVDAGAHIGTSSLSFARKYPAAQIIAIEPEEGNFDMLVENTRNYANIIPLRAALWGTPGKRMIQNRFSGNWGYSMLEPDPRRKTISTGQEIDCVTLPFLMEKYGFDRIDLLKLDIEGSEKNVLENAADWINSVDVITAELHDRIVMGCDRAFYLATRDFKTFERHGEKLTAYRD